MGQKKFFFNNTLAGVSLSFFQLSALVFNRNDSASAFNKLCDTHKEVKTLEVMKMVFNVLFCSYQLLLVFFTSLRNSYIIVLLAFTLIIILSIGQWSEEVSNYQTHTASCEAWLIYHLTCTYLLLF